METPVTFRGQRPVVAFERGLALHELPRQTLAVLGREWLMHGHLQDRIGMPMALATCTREQMQEIAIDEWMAVSPVYSRRMQRALGFVGDGVDTIFKNLQLDIGAPHQFLDFVLTLHDHDHGEFELAHCGALMDVEPMGEEFVHGMCHTIEDPTFDATAVATNPHCQVRPVHRPPRVPVDRSPHCHWTVTIDESNPAVSPHPNVALVESSVAARCHVDPPGTSTEPGGIDDYSGPFDPGFQFEDMSQAALAVTLQEIALQSHLLLRGYCLALVDRMGLDAATVVATVAKMAVGLGGITSERITRAFELDHGPQGLAAMLTIHPMFWPRTYVSPSVTVDGDTVRFAIGDDSPIFDEVDDFTWLASMPGAADRAILAIARGFDPRATVGPADARSGERCAYRIGIDESADPAPTEPEVELVRISTGASFEFTRRRAVR